MSHIFACSSSAAFVIALASVGCSSDDSEVDQVVAPQLSEKRAAALEFWWEQGDGASGQHLVIARGSRSGARLALFELQPGGSRWRRLFEPPAPTLTVAAVELALNETVNRAVRDMIAARLADELGGRDPFELQVEPTLDAGEDEALDAVVLGSALVVVPSALDVATRDAWFDALVFAHAAAVRRETAQADADAAAYGQTFFEVLATVGWVTSASTSGTVSSRGVVPRGDLLATMAQEAEAEPWLRALGLLDPLPSAP